MVITKMSSSFSAKNLQAGVEGNDGIHTQHGLPFAQSGWARIANAYVSNRSKSTKKRATRERRPEIIEAQHNSVQSNSAKDSTSYHLTPRTIKTGMVAAMNGLLRLICVAERVGPLYDAGAYLKAGVWAASMQEDRGAQTAS
jgi:hypothetical protein